MTFELNYHSNVQRQIGFSILFVALVLVPGLQAQIHGVPPSVTSMGPGRGLTPGVPASVTSLGPNGFLPDDQFFTVPNCCINPLFPRNPNPPLFRGRHHRFFSSFPVAVPVYTTPYYSDVVPGPVDDSMEEEDYAGGPTIFDRRGPGPRARAYDDRFSNRYGSAPPATSAKLEPEPSQAIAVTDQPKTVLVFKDGHKLEVKNYAIQGDVLYDLTPGHPRKITLADLDMSATQKQNDDRGIDFQLPARTNGN